MAAGGLFRKARDVGKLCRGQGTTIHEGQENGAARRIGKKGGDAGDFWAFVHGSSLIEPLGQANGLCLLL